MNFGEHYLKISLPSAIFEPKDWCDFFSNNKIAGFSIDSRDVKKDEAFIALQGEKFDGHDFLEQAIKNGASTLIINKNKKNKLDQISKDVLSKKLIILVDDTLKALIELAKNWRQKFSFPVIGITGSLGKTTTKEMLANILSVAKYKAFVSFKNQNTVIGLSLNILKMQKNYKAAIFELGINGVGEMDELVDILQPTTALITSINNAHTHGLKNLQGVAKEKKKIFKHFKQNNIGIINGDQPILSKVFYDYPVVRFGLKTKNQIQARQVRVEQNNEQQKLCISYNLKLYSNKKRIFLNGNHIGLVNNSLAASSIANLLDISFEDIVKGLQTYKAFENRFEQKKLKDNLGSIISDCYNASPDSMKAAILAFSQIKNDGKKIAILGDMLELGESTIKFHKEIQELLQKDKKKYIISVGKFAKYYKSDLHFPKVEKLIFSKKYEAFPLEAVILLKASHSINLEKIIGWL